MTEPSLKTNRRWFQFRLRTLLIVTTIIAVWFGWWSHKTRQQREAVAALQRAEARVRYDFQVRGLERPRYWPAWLVDVVGVDYFANVTSVDLRGTMNMNYELVNSHFTDASLDALNDLTAIQELDLTGTKVTDEGLKRLKSLSTLQTLYLNYTPITDAGLEHIQCLTSLQRLCIQYTPITDAAAARLKQSMSNCDIVHNYQPLRP